MKSQLEKLDSLRAAATHKARSFTNSVKRRGAKFMAAVYAMKQRGMSETEAQRAAGALHPEPDPAAYAELDDYTVGLALCQAPGGWQWHLSISGRQGTDVGRSEILERLRVPKGTPMLELTHGRHWMWPATRAEEIRG